MENFQPQQSITNTAAKRASSSERNRWRDAGVDPDLLQVVTPLLAAVVRLEAVADSLDRQLAPLPVTAVEA